MPELETIAAFTLALVPLSALNAGVTTILTSSSLFAPLRRFLAGLGGLDEDADNALAELVSCDMCTGTWVGGGIAAVAVPWAGLTGLDALLVGIIIALGTMTGGLVLKAIGDF